MSDQIKQRLDDCLKSPHPYSDTALMILVSDCRTLIEELEIENAGLKRACQSAWNDQCTQLQQRIEEQERLLKQLEEQERQIEQLNLAIGGFKATRTQMVKADLERQRIIDEAMWLLRNTPALLHGSGNTDIWTSRRDHWMKGMNDYPTN